MPSDPERRGCTAHVRAQPPQREGARARGESGVEWQHGRPAPPGISSPVPTPARALCASERAHVLDVLASPRFVDRSPAEVVATLLDEGQYLCAERTMYRILLRTSRSESGEISSAIPATPSPSWPRGPTRPGPGTSPGSGGPNAGRPSTSTSCSTSSAATSWAGWLPTGRTPRSPRR